MKEKYREQEVIKKTYNEIRQKTIMLVCNNAIDKTPPFEVQIHSKKRNQKRYKNGKYRLKRCKKVSDLSVYGIF